MTHSLVFAVITGLALGPPIASRQKLEKIRFSVFLFLTAISHGIIDACTTGGLGVAVVPFGFFPSAEWLF